MRNVLLRLSGAGAIAGGAMRLAEPLLRNTLDRQSLQFTYFAIDALLLFGIIGWYLSRSERLGVTGLIGFATGILGILIIRSSSLFGAGGYQVGAAALLVGLAIMNAPTLIKRDGPIAPPLFWLASLLCGFASLVLTPLAIAAGLLFGLGYVLAGAALLRS